MVDHQKNPPLLIELCSGTGRISAAFLALGWTCIGIDLRRDRDYPGQLIIQDVRTLDGHRCAGASLIWASPPCTEFSLARYPKRAPDHTPDLSILDACFRIAADARTPIILENVYGLTRWLGAPAHHYGKFYLWGNGVPALLPQGPRWKDRQKIHHRSPRLRAQIPDELAAAIANFWNERARNL